MAWATVQYYPEKKVGAVSGWHWISTDVGAWEGPKKDWENSHAEKIRNYVKRYNVVVQAGGNQGMYPRLLANMFNQVYTFEPDAMNFQCLAQNCPMENIIKIQAALGQHSGTFCSVEQASNTNTGMHKVKISDGIVPVMSIDSLNLSRCDLLMLDLEQFEIHAIRGALQTIQRCKPVIFIERPTPELVGVLSGVGYSIKDTSAMDSIFMA